MPFKTWFHGEKPPAYSTHDFDAKPPPPPTPEELEKARLKAKYAGVERAAVDSYKLSQNKDKVLPTTTTLANKVEELERAVKEQTAIAEAANKRAETAEQRADDEKQRAEKTISDLAAAIKAAVEAAVAGIRGETTAAVTAVVAGEVERTAAAVAAAVEMVVVRERARGEEALAKQGEAMVVNMVLFN